MRQSGSNRPYIFVLLIIVYMPSQIRSEKDEMNEAIR